MTKPTLRIELEDTIRSSTDLQEFAAGTLSSVGFGHRYSNLRFGHCIITTVSRQPETVLDWRFRPQNLGRGPNDMSKHLERDLRSLAEKLLVISAKVEDMITKACQALRERRSDLARAVIDSDDAVDALEVEIEEDCLKILALHQPVAVDLRRTATVLKINNDLERIADLAANTAERGARLIVFSEFVVPASLYIMADKAVAMVHAALDSFVIMDAEAARQVCRQDDDVDEINVEVIGELCRVMQGDPSMVEPALHCFSASRHIERIADHATNIAEDVIYLVQGEIARHKHDDLPPTHGSRLPAMP